MNDTTTKSGSTPRTTSTTDASVHADGKTLLAVAEGDASKQPDETTLAHIFACEKCSASLREIRMSIAGLAGLGGMRGGAVVPPSADSIDLETIVEPASEEDQALERAQKMFWKVALLGGLLALGLIFLRGSAAHLN